MLETIVVESEFAKRSEMPSSHKIVLDGFPDLLEI